jgi:hypothetical protein
MRPNRRQIFTAGAVVAASTVAASTLTATEAYAGPYGSGDLGAWENMSRAAQVGDVVRETAGLACDPVLRLGLTT